MIYITFAVYAVAAAMFYMGICFFRGYLNEDMRFENRILSKGKLIIKMHDSKGLVTPLKEVGYDIKRADYEFYRAALSLCLLLAAPATGNRLWLSLSVLLYFMSLPIPAALGYPTPFGIAVNILKKRRLEKIAREIYEGICYIRNYIAMNPEKGTGTDHVLEQMTRYDGVLKMAYIRMLSLVRLNNKAEALEVFVREAGEQFGKDYGRILLQLDELPVLETEETLITYQRNLREMRITELKKKDEMISDIIYLPVVVNILLIFVNFVYVAYFVQQQQALNAMITG